MVPEALISLLASAYNVWVMDVITVTQSIRRRTAGIDRWLGRLANVGIVVVAVVASIQAYRLLTPTREPKPAYAAGELLDIGGTPVKVPTLIVVTRSTCSFCTASMPFYGSLKFEPILWVAAGGEDVGTNEAYLSNHGIQPASVLTLADAGLTKVKATPTVILVDAGGRVVRSWTGRLSPETEREVKRTLEGGRR